MGQNVRLFLCGLANSFNPNGYYNIVTPPRKLGESSSLLNKKLKKRYKKVLKESDDQLARITIC